MPLGELIDPLAKMGQVLFAPPSVKGWRTGTDWPTSAMLLARNNFAETVALGAWPRRSVRQQVEPEGLPLTPKDAAVAEAVAVEVIAQPAAAALGAAAVYGSKIATDPGGVDHLTIFGAVVPPGGAVGLLIPGASGRADGPAARPDADAVRAEADERRRGSDADG